MQTIKESDKLKSSNTREIVSTALLSVTSIAEKATEAAKASEMATGTSMNKAKFIRKTNLSKRYVIHPTATIVTVMIAIPNTLMECNIYQKGICLNGRKEIIFSKQNDSMLWKQYNSSHQMCHEI